MDSPPEVASAVPIETPESPESTLLKMLLLIVCLWVQKRGVDVNVNVNSCDPGGVSDGYNRL